MQPLNRQHVQRRAQTGRQLSAAVYFPRQLHCGSDAATGVKVQIRKFRATYSRPNAGSQIRCVLSSLLPPGGRRPQTEPHRWSAVAASPAAPATGPAGAHPASPSNSCPPCAQAAGI